MEAIKGAVEKDEPIQPFVFLTGSHFLHGWQDGSDIISFSNPAAVRSDAAPRPCLLAKVGRLRLTLGAPLTNQEDK